MKRIFLVCIISFFTAEFVQGAAASPTEEASPTVEELREKREYENLTKILENPAKIKELAELSIYKKWFDQNDERWNAGWLNAVLPKYEAEIKSILLKGKEAAIRMKQGQNLQWIIEQRDEANKYLELLKPGPWLDKANAAIEKAENKALELKKEAVLEKFAEMKKAMEIAKDRQHFFTHVKKKQPWTPKERTPEQAKELIKTFFAPIVSPKAQPSAIKYGMTEEEHGYEKPAVIKKLTELWLYKKWLAEGGGVWNPSSLEVYLKALLPDYENIIKSALFRGKHADERIKQGQNWEWVIEQHDEAKKYLDLLTPGPWLDEANEAIEKARTNVLLETADKIERAQEEEKDEADFRAYRKSKETEALNKAQMEAAAAEKVPEKAAELVSPVAEQAASAEGPEARSSTNQQAAASETPINRPKSPTAEQVALAEGLEARPKSPAAEQAASAERPEARPPTNQQVVASETPINRPMSPAAGQVASEAISSAKNRPESPAAEQAVSEARPSATNQQVVASEIPINRPESPAARQAGSAERPVSPAAAKLEEYAKLFEKPEGGNPEEIAELANLQKPGTSYSQIIRTMKELRKAQEGMLNPELKPELDKTMEKLKNAKKEEEDEALERARLLKSSNAAAAEEAHNKPFWQRSLEWLGVMKK